MGDPASGLGEAVPLPFREMDCMAEDRPRPEPAGGVVYVGVVERFGEEPGDLRDLVEVLGEVRLPVRAGLGGKLGRGTQHLRRAGDCEAWRERVAQPPRVAQVPPPAQV